MCASITALTTPLRLIGCDNFSER